MSDTRKRQIVETLEENMSSTATNSNNMELEAQLDKIVEGLSGIIFEKTHSECRTVMDLREEVERIIRESDSIDPVKAGLLTKTLGELEKYIKCIKSGNNGEKRAQVETGHLDVDGMTRILSNFTIKEENGDTAEFDEIVLNPNGVFIIEIKNIKDDAKIDKHGNLVRVSGGKLADYTNEARKRKHLLMKAIKDAMEANDIYDAAPQIDEILLWANGSSTISNEKGKAVNICKLYNVCDFIENYECSRKLDKERIDFFYDSLERIAHTWEYGYNDVDVTLLYETFAYVIAAYEDEKLEKMEAVYTETAEETTEKTVKVTENEKDSLAHHLKNVLNNKWVRKVGSGLAAGIGCAVGTLAVRKIFERV